MKMVFVLFSMITGPAVAAETFEAKDLSPQSINSVLEKVKEKVCVMTLRPDTVQVSAGPVVLTWTTERICTE